MSFTDKVAVVTGAGSGIGRATAQRLAREGAAVVAGDLNLDTALDHRPDHRLGWRSPPPVQADVRSLADLQRLAWLAQDTFGRLTSG